MRARSLYWPPPISGFLPIAVSISSFSCSQVAVKPFSLHFTITSLLTSSPTPPPVSLHRKSAAITKNPQLGFFLGPMRIVVTFFRSDGPTLLFTSSTGFPGDFLTKGKGAVAAFVLLGRLLLFNGTEVVWLLAVFPFDAIGALFEARTVFLWDGTGEGDWPRPPFESLPSSNPEFRLSLRRSLGLGPSRLKNLEGPSKSPSFCVGL